MVLAPDRGGWICPGGGDESSDCRSIQSAEYDNAALLLERRMGANRADADDELIEGAVAKALTGAPDAARDAVIKERSMGMS